MNHHHRPRVDGSFVVEERELISYDFGKKMMEKKMVIVALVVVAVLMGRGYSLPSAMLWSPHYRIESSVVEYQTVSPKDVAKSIMSHLMCSDEEDKPPLDVALVFVGTQLHSSDKNLLNLLKVSFTRSNFSLAFPYVAASEDHSFSLSLLSGFSQICGHHTHMAFSESCTLAPPHAPKLSNLDSLNDYLALRAEKRAKKGEADVVVFCHGGGDGGAISDSNSNSEGETLAKLVNSVDQSGERYAVLYLSETLRPIQYPSSREVERFLAEVTNVTSCGEVCKIKSSLLEGLLVGIVLLIILISGICCMMGIDTPTRFEVPQDS